jgi:hypothetical protein
MEILEIGRFVSDAVPTYRPPTRYVFGSPYSVTLLPHSPVLSDILLSI